MLCHWNIWNYYHHVCFNLFVICRNIVNMFMLTVVCWYIYCYTIIHQWNNIMTILFVSRLYLKVNSYWLIWSFFSFANSACVSHEIILVTWFVCEGYMEWNMLCHYFSEYIHYQVHFEYINDLLIVYCYQVHLGFFNDLWIVYCFFYVKSWYTCVYWNTID